MVKEELVSIASALVGGARYGIKIRLPHALVMTFLFRRDLSSKQKVENILHLAYQHASSLAAFATIYKTILALLKLVHRKLVLLSSAQQQEQEISVWKSIGRALLLRIVDGPLPGERQLIHQVAPAAPPGHPERIHHAFIAGAVGGYFVWGRYSSLNHQIILYLASRVLAGLWTWKRLGRQPSQSLLNGSTTTTNDAVSSTSNHQPREFSFVAALVWAVVMALWEESPEALHPSLKKSMDEIYRYSFRRQSSSSSSSPPSLKFEEVDDSLESRVIQE